MPAFVGVVFAQAFKYSINYTLWDLSFRHATSIPQRQSTMLDKHSFEVLLPARVVAPFCIENPLLLVAARLTGGADPAREGKEK